MASRAEPSSDSVVLPIQIPRAPAAEQGSLAALLHYEGEVRARASVNELIYHVANETRRIAVYDQMFVLRAPRIGGGFHVVGASSLAVIDRNAPLIHAIEQALAKRRDELGQALSCDTSDISQDQAVTEYPFQSWYWQPLLDRSGEVFAGLILARTLPMSDAEAIRLARVAETVGHAWRALTNDKPAPRFRALHSRERRWVAIGLLGLALFPVRLTALAPVEIVSARPFIVSAPYAGVIDKILVAPNARVNAGDPVLMFEDIKVRNELAQASERLEVAKAKIERSTSAAFGKADEARDIATLRAEYDLAQTDFRFARDLMAKSQVKAPLAGMAIYSDRRDWEGRAVNVGEPILQIADPNEVVFQIDLPTKEQLTLAPGAKVKVWLDAQPLWALGGTIETASYQARPTADGILAFAVTAKPEGEAPRIGSRGTAKLYGRWVPLSYSVFKRPISSIRQFFGL